MDLRIKELEEYLYMNYKDKCDSQGLFMKLVEEIGEVAEVLNMMSGRKDIDSLNLNNELGKELTDIIHYTFAIAAVNHIDLNEVIISKDKEASLKYNRLENLEKFVLNKRK